MRTIVKQELCLRGHVRSPENVYKNGNCIPCSKDMFRRKYNDPVYRNKKLESARAYQKTDAGKSSDMKAKYGITMDDYRNLLIKQDYKCAVCFAHNASLSRPLNIDHNHQTGKIRGLLCCNCNTSLGLLKENPITIKSLLVYIGEKNV